MQTRDLYYKKNSRHNGLSGVVTATSKRTSKKIDSSKHITPKAGELLYARADKKDLEKAKPKKGLKLSLKGKAAEGKSSVDSSKKQNGFLGIFKTKIMRPATIALVASIIVLACGFGVVYGMEKDIIVVDDGVATTYSTRSFTVAKALDSQDIYLADGDEISPSVDYSIKDGDTITIKRVKEFTLIDGIEEIAMRSTALNVDELIATLDIPLGEEDVLLTELNELLSNGMTIAITRNRTKFITETVAIDFTTTTNSVTDLSPGERRVVQDGKTGTREIVYKVCFQNGEEISRDVESEEVVEKPVTAIIDVGSVPITASRGTGNDGALRYSKVLTMTATAYDPSVGNRTATGIAPYKGVVAVDPRVIPLGTRLYVETSDGSYVYGNAVAADTGGAIKGNKIDLWLPSRAEALSFGRRTVTVYVLE